MRIAVTGSTGFIGRHVLSQMERAGIRAAALVREGTRADIVGAAHDVIPFDMDRPAAEAFAAAGQPDVLLHLAWGGLPNYTSLHHFEIELPLHYRWLKGMVHAGLRHLVAAGTCFEYGMQSGRLDESLPAQPANPYAFAKHALCTQLGFAIQGTPFEFTWARLFYMWGDGQPAGSLYPQLQAAAARGDAAIAMSGGEQLRDYLPVEDVARNLVGLAALSRGVGVVNVCSGRPVSIRALVERWIAEHGWSVRPDWGRLPYPAHEPMQFWGDDAKLRACERAG